MKVEKIEIDSAVFGRNVLALTAVTPSDDLVAAEAAYRGQFQPVYVSCRVGLEELATIHHLEAHGFELIECQIRSGIRFKKDYEVSRFPYEYQRVTTPAALDQVLEIAERTVVHDRFTVDAAVPAGISGERYRRYVCKSFSAPDEAVWRLFDGTRRSPAVSRGRPPGFQGPWPGGDFIVFLLQSDEAGRHPQSRHPYFCHQLPGF